MIAAPHQHVHKSGTKIQAEQMPWTFLKRTNCHRWVL